MSEYIDFLNLSNPSKMDEQRLVVLQAAIQPQIERARAKLKRFEIELADAVELESLLINRLAETSALDTDDTALRLVYEQIGQKVLPLRKMTQDLSTLCLRLVNQEIALKSAYMRLQGERWKIEEAATAAKARQEAQDAAKQLAYEKLRSTRALEGDQAALDWPDTYQEHEAQEAARNQAAKDTQKAAQDAQNAAREAEEKNRVQRVSQWLERLTSS